MRSSVLLPALLLVLAVFGAVRWGKVSGTGASPPPATVARKLAPTLEVSPVCPWRQPQRDLAELFPSATNYITETCILSEVTTQLRQRLGRHLSSDENPLHIYRVRAGGAQRHSVLVTRVKAEHGGIELVIGIEASGAVRGLLIQSHREPEAIAEVFLGSAFRGAFVGKTVTAPLRVGEDLPEVPLAARASAQALADGVRSQLLVLSFAENLLAARPSAAQTNH